MDVLVECVVDSIWLFENGRYRKGLPPVYISLEIEEFLNELLDDVDNLEDRYCELKSDEQAIKELVDKWSAHKLLEDWKQKREANGGCKVEKQVVYSYRSFFGKEGS
jgi:hypothetical protein